MEKGLFRHRKQRCHREMDISRQWASKLISLCPRCPLWSIKGLLDSTTEPRVPSRRVGPSAAVSSYRRRVRAALRRSSLLIRLPRRWGHERGAAVSCVCCGRTSRLDDPQCDLGLILAPGRAAYRRFTGFHRRDRTPEPGLRLQSWGRAWGISISARTRGNRGSPRLLREKRS
jgi:hypothetical protein